MPRRRLHILVALVVLAMCRIVHDSIFTTAPAAEASAVVETATTQPAESTPMSVGESMRPTTRPTLDTLDGNRLDWADLLYNPKTVAIDDPPEATALPTDAIVWRQLLERDRTIVVSDGPEILSGSGNRTSASPIALVDDDSPANVTRSDVLWSSGGSGDPGGGSGGGTPQEPVTQLPPRLDPLPLIVTTPPDIGGGDTLPPSGVSAPGVGSTPAPEPANLWFAAIFLAIPRRAGR